MLRQLLTNIKTNLIFYRRNKLLIVIIIFLFLFLSLMLIPTFLFLTTETQKFLLIKTIIDQLSGFIVILAAIFGLLTMSHHIRNRSIKMVLTKPCSTGLLLISHFFSATIVCFVLYVLVYLIAIVLFSFWNIPLQWGLLYVLVNSFCQAIIILSITTFLTMIIHPVIAILFVLAINESTFYHLTSLATVGIEKIKQPFFLAFLKGIRPVLNFFYMTFPSYSPFSEKLAHVTSSYRVEAADLKYLLFNILYASILFVFLFLISNDVLKRRRFI